MIPPISSGKYKEFISKRKEFNIHEIDDMKYKALGIQYKAAEGECVINNYLENELNEQEKKEFSLIFGHNRKRNSLFS